MKKEKANRMPKKKREEWQSNSLGIPPHKVRADTKRIRLTISFSLLFLAAGRGSVEGKKEQAKTPEVQA